MDYRFGKIKYLLLVLALIVTGCGSVQQALDSELDNNAVNVQGLENGQTYNETVTFTIPEIASSIMIATLDGEPFLLTYETPKEIIIPGEHVLSIQIKDILGTLISSYEATFTISNPNYDSTPPGEVQNLAFSSPYDDTIILTWDKPNDTDYDGVYIYRDGAASEIVSENRFTFEYEDYGSLVPNTTYLYLVKTIDLDGNMSEGITLSTRTLSE
jgi:hypothetical protein